MPGKNDATMAYIAAPVLPDASCVYDNRISLLYPTPLI